MKLSVIIVSYNVRYFLEKCIISVQKALEGIAGEIIVIDNQSLDKSEELVRTRFPGVRLISNQENKGFAKACNQGLKICTGEYALLLNPDTLVSEDTFRKCIDFMDAHPDASACGVRMVDGTGEFLPESMRGLPTPASAFFKMTGISALFPHSPFFNSYYMGGKDPSEIHAVPVLTGAFMFMRMSVIRQVGMLDEDYFMYGEDIDLCYRMVKSGHHNYYLPEPAIIHYKGESTHRGSIRYVIHFYRAMMIYVSKHFSGAGGQLFKVMIMLAVLVRGLLGGVKRILKNGLPVLIDLLILVGVLLLVTLIWASGYFHDPEHFDKGYYSINVPLYCGVWLLFLFLAGAHDMHRNGRRIFYGMCIGTICILVIYAVLPLQYRSSRAVIFISAFTSTIVMILSAVLMNSVRNETRVSRRIAIVASPEEVHRILELINRTKTTGIISGWIAPNENDHGPSCLGPVSQLSTITRQHQIDELIFSTHDMSFNEINTWMSRLGTSIVYRIASSGSEQIVGSDSKKEQGTLYTADVEFALAYPAHRRAKRIFDCIASFFLLILLPFSSLFRKKSSEKLRVILSVLKGKQTWIGYHPADPLLEELPVLPQAIIYVDGNRASALQETEVHMINYIYAREYSVWRDIDILLRQLSKLI